MKRFFLICAALSALIISCNKEEKGRGNGNVDPNEAYVPENEGKVFVDGIESAFVTGKLSTLINPTETRSVKFGTVVLDENDVTAIQSLEAVKSLDLTHVVFKSSGATYKGYTGYSLNIVENELPEMLIDGMNFLEELWTPYHVTSYGPLNIAYCKSLKKVHIYDWVESMGRYCMSELPALLEAPVPSSLTFVNECYNHLRLVKGISIPENLAAAPSSFSDLPDLVRVVLNSPAWGQSDGAFFSRCPKIESWSFGKKVKNLEADSKGIVRNKEKSILLYLPNSVFPSSGTFTVPECELYAAYLFAFRSMPSVRVKIPEGITSLPLYAFNWSDFEAVEAPSSLTTVRYYSFNFTGKLIMNGAVPPEADESFCGYNGDTLLSGIYVPASAVTAYKEAPSWTVYSKLIKAIE